MQYLELYPFGIGLLYSIRNLILFNQSLLYVAQPGNITYCGDASIFDRINIFSKEWLEIYCSPTSNCNIFAYLIKSSLFGEYFIKPIISNKMTEISINIVSILLLILNIIIVIISLINLVKIVLKKQNDKILNMFISFYIIEMIMYIYGNITKPYGCTMDFRYIVPTIFLGMIFIIKNIENKSKKEIKFTNILFISFAVISIIFELTRNGFTYNLIDRRDM